MRQANQLENWAHIATILGPILVVCGGIWALYKFLNSKKEQVRQWKCEEKRNKQEKLTGIYNNLLRIISLFPNKTPNDIMNLLSYGPNFSSENFDTVNRILEIQIKEDYQKRLKREGLTYQDEEDIKTEIWNREWCIEEITKISKQYFIAKDEYEQFRRNDKIIEIYSSQEVKNCLVEFEVLLNNAFIAGRKLLEYNDGRCNRLDNIRWKLEQLIRADIGVQ
ncbi:hypothetical protein ABZ559_12465 [Streptococcus sp. ZY19097]|uniref:hypothetical protein n=1 Tax=Streptococcus sp. ZY19097 TaxID=3231906 RepID=UPI0034575A95